MTAEEKLLKKRFSELSARASSNYYYTYSEFLTLAEQDLLIRTPLESSYTLIGGYDAAERKLVQFGDESLCGYTEDAPACWICASPAAPKFADKLTHRDFLGSLMGLGIRREVLGDIIIDDNSAYIYCLTSIADYIISEFTQAKHTKIKVSFVTAPPDKAASLPEKSRIVISSERLDAVIAAVYRISRSESQQLFVKEHVFVNSRLITSTSYSPDMGSVISVRGHGRFIYEGIERETKKGRLSASVRIFK